jgi:hypothetical protein
MYAGILLDVVSDVIRVGTYQHEVNKHSSLIDSLRCIFGQLTRIVSFFIDNLKASQNTVDKYFSIQLF